MNALAIQNSTPEVTIHGGKAVTTSISVAEYFQKRHDNVMEKIRAVMAECDDEYRLLNFKETVYERENPSGGAGISTPMFELTRDAFVLIVMGFTGKKALQWKIDYINAFNKMEATISGVAQQASAITQEEKDAYNIGALVTHYKVMIDAWCNQIEPALRQLESPLPGRLNSRFSDGYVFLQQVEKSLNKKLLPGQSARIR